MPHAAGQDIRREDVQLSEVRFEQLQLDFLDFIRATAEKMTRWRRQLTVLGFSFRKNLELSRARSGELTLDLVGGPHELPQNDHDRIYICLGDPFNETIEEEPFLWGILSHIPNMIPFLHHENHEQSQPRDQACAHVNESVTLNSSSMVQNRSEDSTASTNVIAGEDAIAEEGADVGEGVSASEVVKAGGSFHNLVSSGIAFVMFTFSSCFGMGAREDIVSGHRHGYGQGVQIVNVSWLSSCKVSCSACFGLARGRM